MEYRFTVSDPVESTPCGIATPFGIDPQWNRPPVESTPCGIDPLWNCTPVESNLGPKSIPQGRSSRAVDLLSSRALVQHMHTPAIVRGDSIGK